MHVEIGYRKICHLVNRIQLVTMRLSSNLRTGLSQYPKIIKGAYVAQGDI
jgi:hypothetical protein